MKKLRFPRLWHRLARWWDELLAAGEPRRHRGGGARRFHLSVESLEPRWALSGPTGTEVFAPSPGVEGVFRVNVSRRAGDEWEGEIGIDPTNVNRMFTSSNTNVGATGMFAAFSTDAGVTWTTRNVANGSDGLPTACCDPSIAWDNFGNLFLAYLNSAVNQTVLARSSDGGATFTLVQTFTASDQPKVAVNNNSVWLTWNRAGFGVQAVGAPVTGLGTVGAFIPVQTVPTSGGGNFGNIAVGPTGQVMVSFQASGSGVGPDTVRISLDPDGLGPAGFNPPIVATNTTVGGFRPIPAQPLRTIDADGRLFWDRSGGPFNGRVYLDYVDAPTVASNDTNIFVRFSDDNGTTWSAPVRVNDDAGTNSQFWPRLAVDQTTGNVAVSWKDSRNSPANNTTQQFAAISTNGGVSFQPNITVTAAFSSAISNPNGGNEFGDYEGLAFHGGRFYPAWADNSNSTGDNPGGVGGSFDWYTAQFLVAPTAGVTIVQSGGTTVVGEGGATDTITVVLNSVPTANVTITVNNGAQLAGPPTTLTFTPANWNVAQTVTVTAVDDFVAEGAHTGTLSFTSASTDTAYNALTIPNMTVNITDNDGPGVTVVQSGGSTAVAEGGTTDTYTVVLNTIPTANVTITMNPGTQLTLAPAVLTFTPANWNVAQTVTVTAVDDAAIEGAHTGTIAFTTASTDAAYNALAIPAITVAITDNDGPGVTIVQSGGSTNVTEGGAPDTHTVVLNSAPTANVTITINPGTQVTVAPVTLTFTTANFNVAQTVTVSAVDDAAVEGPHTGTITHTATSTDAAYNGIAIASVLVMINDNDTAPGGGSGSEGSFPGSGGGFPVGPEGSFGRGTVGPVNMPPSVPTDTNPAVASVTENAVNGSPVGITLAATDGLLSPITFSLVNSALGRFSVDPVTGVVTVANSSAIDFESSGGSYTITAEASDGILSATTSFTIAVVNVGPTTPVDTNAAANAVPEFTSNGTAAGITALASDPSGSPITYSLSNSAGGRFAINPTTGVVTVANAGAIDFASSGGSYAITVQASDGALTSSANFTINVLHLNVPPTTTGIPAVPVNEDAPATVLSLPSFFNDLESGGTGLTYSILSNSNAALVTPTINSATRQLTLAYAANASGTATVTVRATDTGGLFVDAPVAITVRTVADTPSVTGAATPRDTQTASGLVITRNPVDGAEVTHYKITGISNGTLFLNNGTTPVPAGSFITVAQGSAGLKFTPTAGLGSPETTFGFTVQASLNSSDAGLGGATATAAVTVNARWVTVADSIPTFNWSTVPGAVRYDIWVDNLTTGQSQVIRNSFATGLAWTGPGLPPGNNYRWWLGSVSSSGATTWSAAMTFSTAPLAVPTPVGPTGTTLTETPTFTWGAAAGAARYDVWVDDVTISKSQLFRVSTITGTSWTPGSNLTPGHAYRWWIRSLNSSGGGSLWSSPVDFSIPALSTPTALHPAGTVATETPTFTWTTVAGASVYDVWVANVTTGQSQVLRNSTLSGSSWTSPSVLTPGQTYRWWVGAVSTSGGATTWSSPQTFSIAALAAPVPLNPAGVMGTDRPTFTWTSTGATRYDLWVDNVSTGQAQVIRNTSITGTTWTPSTALTPGHTYRWWVASISTNGAGASWSLVQNFSVPALTTPVPAGPFGTISSTLPTFQWSTVALASRYDLWVDDLTTGQKQVIRNTNITTISWTPTTALVRGHRYRWWVQAASTNGTTSLWSAAAEFTVV